MTKVRNEPGKNARVIINLDALWIKVPEVAANGNATARIDASCANAARSNNLCFAKAIGATGNQRRINRDAHSFKRFVEIGGIGKRIKAGEAVILKHCARRQDAAGADQRRRGQRVATRIDHDRL